MNRFSLKGRLNKRLGLALFLVLLGQWLASSLVMRSLFENKLEHDLGTQMDVLLSGLKKTDGQWSLDELRIPVLYQRPYSGHYYRIRLPEGLLESRSVWDHSWAGQSIAHEATLYSLGFASNRYWLGPDSQSLYSSWRQVKKQGDVLHLWVAEDISEFERDLTRWQFYNAVLSALVLLGFLLYQRFLVAHSLSPLSGVQTQLEALQSGQITQLDAVGLQEVQPLIQEVNHLLTALDKRLNRSREAASNLAHSMKTHLGRLQLMNQHTPPEFQQELNELMAQLVRLIDRETARMRIKGIDANQSSSQRQSKLDPRDVLESLIQSLPKLYPAKNLSIDLRLDERAAIPIDKDDLFELGGILLDNACKWARTSIRVSVIQQADCRVLITVEDDGLALNPDEFDLLGQRGRQLKQESQQSPHRVDEEVQGSGLGLSMAHDIVSLYHAQLSYDASPDLGGLRVSVAWPT